MQMVSEFFVEDDPDTSDQKMAINWVEPGGGWPIYSQVSPEWVMSLQNGWLVLFVFLAHPDDHWHRFDDGGRNLYVDITRA